MASMMHCVARGFMSSERGDIVAREPKQARSSNQAIRMVDLSAATEGNCGAIAFSPTGDAAVYDLEDSLILMAAGEVDSGLLSA